MVQAKVCAGSKPAHELSASLTCAVTWTFCPTSGVSGRPVRLSTDGGLLPQPATARWVSALALEPRESVMVTLMAQSPPASGIRLAAAAPVPTICARLPPGTLTSDQA